jgi:hypothetical protein
LATPAATVPAFRNGFTEMRAWNGALQIADELRQISIEWDGVMRRWRDRLRPAHAGHTYDVLVDFVAGS